MKMWITTTFILSLITTNLADHEYMTIEPEPVLVPLDYNTTLKCVMNIEPDRFHWKFYPLPLEEASNPKALIDLNTANYINVPHNQYTIQRKKSELTIHADRKEIAGDYQCLAFYGASVVASIPWRVTLSTLTDFPYQPNATLEVLTGNTLYWRCEPPVSNPEACIDYYKNDVYILPANTTFDSQSLIIDHLKPADSGSYHCKATNTLHNKESNTYLNLLVNTDITIKKSPTFIVKPKNLYHIQKNQTYFIECSAIGNPIPQVVWFKINGQLPANRVNVIKSGLIIRNIESTDQGDYMCNYTNTHGTISQRITLIYNEPPTIECLMNNTEIKQGENLDLDCHIGGTPKPLIAWFLNGYTVINDSAIKIVDNHIYFRPIEKRHAGNLQIFARNMVGTVNGSISIKVIPIPNSGDEPSTIRPTVVVQQPQQHHRHNVGGNRLVPPRKSPKHTKMVPPNKPSISRLNDEAVVVRWSVPANKGLPIQFFKVQYRELGPANVGTNGVGEHARNKGSRWKTTNADIPPHITSYEVNNLKPDYIYRFRIAAVYSNNDNKLSHNSDKFHLRKLDFDKRNPLPIPLITHTESINATAVKLYWKYTPQTNISIDGFFINYISASSAADYMKATVDGDQIDSYILTHLQPDTVYDIKLQSFTSKSASEFSSIMKARTLALISTTTPKELTTIVANVESGGVGKLYTFIAAGVIGISALIVCIICLLLFCRKWKQKSRGDRDKATVDDHHIQADANEYVVGPKSLGRGNGCLTSNHITITSNPLAEADNKTQNVIELSAIPTQNNNCTNQQPSASNDDTLTNKRKDKRRTNKNPGENYV